MPYDRNTHEVLRGPDKTITEGHYASDGMADLVDAIQEAHLLKAAPDAEKVHNAVNKKARHQSQEDAARMQRLVRGVMELNRS